MKLAFLDDIYRYLEITDQWQVHVPQTSKYKDKLAKMGIEDGKWIKSTHLITNLLDIFDKIEEKVEGYIMLNTITFTHGFEEKLLFGLQFDFLPSNVNTDKLKKFIAEWIKTSDILIPSFILEENKRLVIDLY